jgi:hypothetical protein
MPKCHGMSLRCARTRQMGWPVVFGLREMAAIVIANERFPVVGGVISPYCGTLETYPFGQSLQGFDTAVKHPLYLVGGHCSKPANRACREHVFGTRVAVAVARLAADPRKHHTGPH